MDRRPDAGVDWHLGKSFKLDSLPRETQFGPGAKARTHTTTIALRPI